VTLLGGALRKCTGSQGCYSSHDVQWKRMCSGEGGGGGEEQDV
jgi:hypothetical protein